MPALIAEPEVARVEETGPEGRWSVFHYLPVGLFSLKMSRATSTAGKTLLVPTPYAIKMACVDVALRHALTDHADWLIRDLAKATIRIGVPQHACVTGTIQSVRQETRDSERKQNRDLPFYKSSIAMREVVHYRGVLNVAFDRTTCSERLTDLLTRAAPAINYFGKRGSFFQYRGSTFFDELDSTFTEPSEDAAPPVWGHQAALDDFGPKATFAALNSFSPAAIERGVHRTFVDTMIPLGPYNAGPGFVHYCAPGAIL
jgi:hypothetical protein